LKQQILLLFLLCLCLCSREQLFAQNMLQGTVVDFGSRHPVDAVTVYNSSGKIRITDSLGKFTMPVNNTDTIWFSFLGKNTQKYPVDTIANLSNFEIALRIEAAWLPSVKVKSTDYKLDSLLNRRNYAKIFDYQKPGLKLSSNPPSSYVPGSVTVGLDLDALIDVFRFKKRRQMLSLQNRLLQEEQDKYINHRFTKRLVKQLTGVDSLAINRFMTIYRPEYFILLQMNDIELGYYIQKCYEQYTGKGRKDVFLRKPDEEN